MSQVLPPSLVRANSDGRRAKPISGVTNTALRMARPLIVDRLSQVFPPSVDTSSVLLRTYRIVSGGKKKMSVPVENGVTIGSRSSERSQLTPPSVE